MMKDIFTKKKKSYKFILMVFEVSLKIFLRYLEASLRVLYFKICVLGISYLKIFLKILSILVIVGNINKYHSYKCLIFFKLFSNNKIINVHYIKYVMSNLIIYDRDLFN